jgi:predicted dehydrogenase
MVAVVSRGGPKFEETREKWGIPQEICYTDFDEALKCEADLVIVAMPHRFHIPYARKAVLAGKNVLIEKPLTDDFEEAMEFLKFMEGRKEKAFVSQNYRFRPQLWQMKASFGEDNIGEPAWANVTFRHGVSNEKYSAKTAWQRTEWRLQQKDLLLLEVAIHHFDMMRFISRSNVKNVYARGWNPEWSDLNGVGSAFVLLEFENGFRVNYSVTEKSIGFPCGYQANWIMQTDKGAVIWENDEPNRLDMSQGLEGKLIEEYYFPGKDRAGVLHEVIRQLKGEKGAVPTVFDNINSLAISFAVLRSIEEDRTVAISEFI